MKPLTIVLPWSALAGDNHRLTRNRTTGRTFTTAKYRAAKSAAACLFHAFHGGANAITTPVKVEGRVWVPDARRRDVGNFRKLVTDAMQEGGLLVDDCLVHDERWIRVGIDRRNPRMVVTITPLEAACA